MILLDSEVPAAEQHMIFELRGDPGVAIGPACQLEWTRSTCQQLQLRIGVNLWLALQSCGDVHAGTRLQRLQKQPTNGGAQAQAGCRFGYSSSCRAVRFNIRPAARCLNWRGAGGHLSSAICWCCCVAGTAESKKSNLWASNAGKKSANYLSMGKSLSQTTAR
jgi:hypothetical protein